jgi:hypothetical protein
MKKILFFGLTILFGALFAFGQTTTGRLTGTVNGPDGVLPSATVTAKDNKTGKEFTVSANEDGSFLFPQLEFGTYTITISAQGFKTFVANEVKIDVGRDYSLNPTLEIGNIQESVTVTAGAEIVTSTSAQITNTVSPQQIISLPLLTRNPLDVTTLQAGTADNDFTNTSINGMRSTFTNITRDGINIQDAFIRANATDFAPGRPSVDDTGEFTISTGNQEADQGYGGAQIRLVTPRGTKDLHGALFAYNRNSAFGANNFFNNRSNIARPFRNRNQFGGKVSGQFPVPNFGEGGPYYQKDKGFYFFAYEGIRDPQPATANLNRTILTPSARAGTFQFNRASAGDPINGGGLSCPSGAVGSVCTVTNLLTFAQAQGLAVPGAIDPIIQARIIDKLPATSNFAGGDGLNTAGYRTTRAADQTRNTYTTRIDLDATEKDSFNGVFSYNKETNLRPDADLYSFGTTPGVNQFSANKMFVAAYRRIFSSNIVNEFRGGIFTSEVPFDRTDDIPPFLFGASTTTGILANLFQGNLFQGGIISNPENNFLDQGRKTEGINFQDNVDWIVGKHSFRFGGQLQYFKVDSYNEGGTIPTVVLAAGGNTPAFTANTNFANQCTPAPCASTATSVISAEQLGTANNLLALFGGLVNTATQNFNLSDLSSGFQPIRSYTPYRYANHAFYFSDRWSAARGLTISLGLRYELFPAMKLDNGLALEPVYANNDDPVPSLLNINGTTNVVGTNAGVENAYYKTDYNNFAPSIGVAYTPNFKSGIGKFLFGSEGQSVLRGGYSQAYGNDSIVTSINNAAVGNPGLAGTRTTLVNLNSRISGGLPAINAPAFTTPPRTYLLNNGQANFFATVFGIDPNIQTPKVEQYSIGYQREFFGNLAFEIRYVGSRSDNLVRGVDLNQIDIFSNGFLADFNRALANDRLTGNPFCTAADNAGCQSLTIFRQSAGAAGKLGVAPTTAATPAGTVARNTFLTNLRNGTPADLALAYINSAGNLNNHPAAANPAAVPFISFVKNPAAGAVNLMMNDASYHYNSLQIEVRRRFADGLYFQANYTFAKNLTNAVGTGQTLFEPYLDNNNKDLDKQRADFDQTHTFNFNGIYQLPFGKGKTFLNNGGAMDKVFGGWEISSIVQWTSGGPITFVDTRGTLNRTGRSARQTPVTNLTNDEIRALEGIYEANGKIYFINPSVINAATGRASEGFGTTPFSGQAFFTPEPGQTGNMARNVIDGPKYFNINMALLKNIRFTESMKVQLRAEAFNVLNNTNFAFSSVTEQLQLITANTFGQVTTARTPRTMQFAFRFEF